MSPRMVPDGVGRGGVIPNSIHSPFQIGDNLVAPREDHHPLRAEGDPADPVPHHVEVDQPSIARQGVRPGNEEIGQERPPPALEALPRGEPVLEGVQKFDTGQGPDVFEQAARFAGLRTLAK